jgi:hypothetical protein
MGSFGLRLARNPSTPPIGVGYRWLAGSLIFAFALALEVSSLRQGSIAPVPFVLVIGAVAFVLGRFGRTAFYLLPTLLAFGGYVAARDYVTRFKLSAHYLPQLRFDEYLTPGPIPTVWLQEHLYHGRTGPLEIFSMLVYGSHFVVPLLFGAGLILTGRGREFVLLMFGILVAVLLGEIVFVLYPTAPPWMAAQDGYVSGVHDILRQTFTDLDLTRLAEMKGDAGKYDVTAAVPSLHVAYPVVCLLAAYYARLSRPVVAACWLNVVSVAFVIVYLGEHYVFDALMGGLCGVLSWYLVRRLDDRRRRSRLEAATAGTARSLA